MGDISELAKSIKSNGQQEPVLIRECKNPVNNIKYEVIFGHRRWKACLLCEQPLFAILKNISDKDAAIAQKEENQNRENLSDYARAFNYRKLLDSKIFSTQSELAAHLGIPKNTLAVLLNYTKIPKKLLEAMKTPHMLPQRTATKISQLTSNINPEELNKLCKIAPGFVNGQISFKNITPSLWAEEGSSIQPTLDDDKFNRRSIKNKLNIPLFTAGLNQNKVPSITFSKVVIENNLYEDVVNLVEAFLKEKTENS
jgi:ParB family chromosome partitioning protein